MEERNCDMEIVKAHCNTCSGDRRHEVLHAEKSEFNDDESGIQGTDMYEMVRCCGCETISLRNSYWCSEDTDQWGTPITRTRYYPPATFRQQPRWLPELNRAIGGADRSVLDLFEEIYIAMQNDSLRLAAMGIRALEHVMVER
jgi:hypothetical protein